ncbi:hypothetical protein JSY14_08235 [Brachybacterium sp. EF45031]|uniref:hypothetical protein n=1 Tax=Brachybacterium sillae TaxID=2810536 RepID=UPI00217EE7BF|nr:hypothetical protein [Brachybacterium sillae]MCS6712007.1 hypothetical protein [Brachybacterium sillae]
MRELSTEAEETLESKGYLHNGKWNAVVGQAGYDFLDSFAIPSVIEAHTGLKVTEPHGGTYIAYLNAGEKLDFHLDDFSFGEVNMLLCVKHEGVPDGSDGSGTVFIGHHGYEKYVLMPGDFLIFDGAFTPHGRTPLVAGERVILLALAFNTTFPRNIDETSLPEPPL